MGLSGRGDHIRVHDLIAAGDIDTVGKTDNLSVRDADIRPEASACIDNRSIFYNQIHTILPFCHRRVFRFQLQSLSAFRTALSITVAPSVQCLTDENSGSQ